MLRLAGELPGNDDNWWDLPAGIPFLEWQLLFTEARHLMASYWNEYVLLLSRLIVLPCR